MSDRRSPEEEAELYREERDALAAENERLRAALERARDDMKGLAWHPSDGVPFAQARQRINEALSVSPPEGEA